MIQPETGSLTIKDLQRSSDPAALSLGRLNVAICFQGCNSWTILRIVHDYYVELHRRYPDSKTWSDKITQLLETEAKWSDASHVSADQPNE